MSTPTPTSFDTPPTDIKYSFIFSIAVLIGWFAMGLILTILQNHDRRLVRLRARAALFKVVALATIHEARRALRRDKRRVARALERERLREQMWEQEREQEQPESPVVELDPDYWGPAASWIGWRQRHHVEEQESPSRTSPPPAAPSTPIIIGDE